MGFNQLPNLLTTLRVLAAPVLAWALLTGNFALAFWIFLAAALTDALDGWIARRFQLTTPYGAVMDPLADKLVTLVCVILLTWLSMVPLWLTLALVVRDTIIVGGAFAYHRVFGEVQIRPTRLGKAHTLLAFALFAGVLADAAGYLELDAVREPFFLLVLILTVASGTQYVLLWGRRAAAEASRRQPR
jgi:cardiolipin synthase